MKAAPETEQDQGLEERGGRGREKLRDREWDREVPVGAAPEMERGQERVQVGEKAVEEAPRGG